MTSSVSADPVAEYLVRHQDRAEAWLFELLRIPSVSADPAYAAHMEAARQALMQRLRQMGLTAVQTLEGGGEPAVYAEYLHRPDKPTILIYGHYDVQPPDPLDAWRSPPFEPTVVGDHIYARGASDVKGSTMIALETVAAFLAVEGACPVNVKIFLEGEEETGSPSLKEIIRRHGERLRADAVLSADGGRASPSHPSINVGARGVTTLEFSVESARKDLHSGRYGGAVRNALHEMSMLLASLHDKNGAIVVDGFLDDVPELLPAQRADTAALPFSEHDFLEEVGGIAGGEPGYTAGAGHLETQHRRQWDVGRVYGSRGQNHHSLPRIRQIVHAPRAWPIPPARPGNRDCPPAAGRHAWDASVYLRPARQLPGFYLVAVPSLGHRRDPQPGLPERQTGSACAAGRLSAHHRLVQGDPGDRYADVRLQPA